MLLPLNSRLSLVSMAGALFLGGLTVGAGSLFAVYHHKLQQVNATNLSLLELNKAQAIMLAQTTQTSLPNLEMDSSAMNAGPAAASTVMPPMPPMPMPPMPSPDGKRSSYTGAAAQPRAAKKPEPKPHQVTTAVAEPEKPAKSSPESTAPPAGISMEQAGITGMDTAGVRFKSGRQVNVGSEFPTGEKLISVNPVEGRIVTDRRVITLIKPAPAL